MKKLLVAFLILFPLCSEAARKTEKVKLEWSRPTVRVNGDKLLLKEIKNYTIYGVLVSEPETKEFDGALLRNVRKSAKTATVYQPICTTWCYAMSATDINGKESALSETRCYISSCPGEN